MSINILNNDEDINKYKNTDFDLSMNNLIENQVFIAL
jgi:hypothetical protein